MADGVLLQAIAPLAILSLALTVFSLLDLIKRPDNAVMGGNRIIWALVILLISTIGPLLYLFIGRVEPPIEER